MADTPMAEFSADVSEGASKVSMSLKMTSEDMRTVLDKPHGTRTRQEIKDGAIGIFSDGYDYAGAGEFASRLRERDAAEGAGMTALDVENLDPRTLGNLLALVRETMRNAKLEVDAGIDPSDTSVVRVKGQFAGGQAFDVVLKQPAATPAAPGTPTATSLDLDGPGETVRDNGATAQRSGFAWRARFSGGDDPENFECENDFNLVKVSTGVINVVAGCGIINFGVNAVGAVLFHNQVETNTNTSTPANTGVASPGGGVGVGTPAPAPAPAPGGIGPVTPPTP